jgi:hypothetical protein
MTRIFYDLGQDPRPWPSVLLQDYAKTCAWSVPLISRLAFDILFLFKKSRTQGKTRLIHRLLSAGGLANSTKSGYCYEGKGILRI